MNEDLEKLMPRVANPYAVYLPLARRDPNVTRQQEGAISFKAATFEEATQAQREADAKWIQEQELVRLPGEEDKEGLHSIAKEVYDELFDHIIPGGIRPDGKLILKADRHELSFTIAKRILANLRNLHWLRERG